MINETLIAYVRKAQSEGMSFDVIRTNLKTGGWNDTDIDEAFRAVMPASVPIPNAPIGQMSSTPFVSASPAPARKSHALLFSIIIFIFLVIGGGAFAFYNGYIPIPTFLSKILNKAPYTEENLISGLSFKIAQINTATYSANTEFGIGDREADAKPFVPVETPADTGYVGSSSDFSGQYFPSEFNVSVGVVADIDFTNQTNSDWKVNFDTTGDFGDLYFQVNFDTLKKGEDLYFKLNNLPSLFSLLPIPKSQWFRLDFEKLDSLLEENISSEEAEQLKDQLSMSKEELQKNIDELISNYEEEKARTIRIGKKSILLADELKLFAFKTEPTVDDSTTQKLYRYDLVFRPGTLGVFLEQFTEILAEEASADPASLEQTINDLRSANAQAFVKYMEENTSIILWVDADGFPETFKIKTRFVPGDNSYTFVGKQFNLATSVSLSNLNKPIEINTPEDSKNFFQFIFESLKANNIQIVNTKLSSHLYQIQKEAENYGDKNGNYGVNTTGACAVSKSVFSSPGIAFSIESIKKTLSEEGIVGKVTCYSSAGAYAISVPLLDYGDGQKYFCVDSAGTARETRSHTVSTVCPSF